MSEKFSPEKPPRPLSLGERALRENIKLIKEYCHDQGQERINESDFSDVYNTKEITNDLAQVERIKEQIKMSDYYEVKDQGVTLHQDRAEALELVIAQEGNEQGWFGEGVQIQRTSEYDDLVNHVDEVVEVPMSHADDPEQKEVKRIALAVDASMNAHLQVVIKKMDRHMNQMLGKDDPLEVKYFQSNIDTHKGGLKAVIPVVLGVSSERAIQLVNDFATLIKWGNRPASDAASHDRYLKKMKEIAAHPAQIIFLWEIKHQLEQYQGALNGREDQMSQHYQTEINTILTWVDSVLEQKNNIGLDGWDKDDLYLAIKAYAQDKL